MKQKPKLKKGDIFKALFWNKSGYYICILLANDKYKVIYSSDGRGPDGNQQIQNLAHPPIPIPHYNTKLGKILYKELHLDDAVRSTNKIFE